MAIEKSYFINAPVSKVWQALVDPDLIEKWGGGPLEMRAEVGAEFTLWGGSIHGTVTEVQPESRLAEDWFGDDWPEPSLVVFELAADGDATRLTLTHTGVPPDQEGDFDTGWDDYYVGPLRDLVEDQATAR